MGTKKFCFFLNNSRHFADKYIGGLDRVARCDNRAEGIAVTREDILEVYRAGPDAVVALVEGLLEIIERQAARIAELEGIVATLTQRVKELEDRLAKDSHNSHKPPSTDAPRAPKPRSLRKPSGRKPGGQEGHEGHTLTMTPNPDHTVEHPVARCEHCGECLADVAPSHVEKRQVFDLPPVRIESTEHCAETKTCPHCGGETKARFPDHVRMSVQYGKRIKALIVYLLNYQLLPYGRTTELVADLFHHTLSTGTLAGMNESCYDRLAFAEQEIKRLLAASPVVNCDETGYRMGGKRRWLHVASTPYLTHYGAHGKRGKEATDAIGILPEFSGTAVHDFWQPYLKYECSHALCNAHHIRELTFIAEQDGQEWATEMIECLVAMHESVEDAKAAGLSSLDPKTIAAFEARYEKAIQHGHEENPPPPPCTGRKKRGRTKQSKAKNLLDRLDEHRRQALAFLYDFRVPFDNNGGERDIRMMKVQQKISGTFRTEHGAHLFARIRGYISTARKQGQRVIDVIRRAFSDTPWLPECQGG
jgi:transposase